MLVLSLSGSGPWGAFGRLVTRSVRQWDLACKAILSRWCRIARLLFLTLSPPLRLFLPLSLRLFSRLLACSPFDSVLACSFVCGSFAPLALAPASHLAGLACLCLAVLSLPGSVLHGARSLMLSFGGFDPWSAFARFVARPSRPWDLVCTAILSRWCRTVRLLSLSVSRKREGGGGAPMILTLCTGGTDALLALACGRLER